MKINLKYHSLVLTFILVSTFASSLYGAQTNLFKGKTSLKKPFELRDPFLAPRVKKVKKNSISSRISNTVYNDSPSIRNVKIVDIEVTGVIIGKSRRAFAKVKGIDRIVVLKEGMNIGENNAEIRAILPGGLILVEKNTNIYGEEEYLETIIPITNQ